MNWEFIIIAACAGLVAGTSARLLLGRLRRGVRVRPGACELLGVGLFAVVAARHTSGGLPAWWLPVPLALSALAVPLVVSDVLRRRLPDALTLPAYGVLGLALVGAALVAGQPMLGLSALLGGVVFFLLHWAVHQAAPQSLGAGDVKLAGSLGGVLGAVGWPALAVGGCYASLFTLALTGFARVARVRAWRGGVPHGPGLLAATWLVAVFPGTGLGVGP